jgi:hypothetical protein
MRHALLLLPLGSHGTKSRAQSQVKSLLVRLETPLWTAHETHAGMYAELIDHPSPQGAKLPLHPMNG